MVYDYRNIRDVLKQSLDCESGEVFVRALLGYAADDYFWDNASDDDCELVSNLLDILLGVIKGLAQE